MTVKDLATELNILPKELQQTLQTLGIETKNASSPVAMDQVERVRGHFSEQKKSSVIVRRRKNSDAEPAPEPKANKAKAKNAVANEHQAAEESVAPANVADTVSPDATETVAQTVAQTVAPEVQAKAKAPKVKTPPAEARVISMPHAHDSEPQSSEAQEEKSTESAASAKASANAVTDESATSTPVQPKSAAKNEQSAPAPAASAEREETRAPSSASHASPDASAMPEGSSAPSLPPRSAERKPAEKAGEAQGDRKKKDRAPKKRPEPEQAHTPVRIISRPSPEAEEKRKAEAAARAATGGHHPGGHHPGGNRGPRPGGHGGPGGQDRGNFRPRPGGAPGGAPGGQDGRDKDAPRSPRPARPGGAHPGGPRPGGGPRPDGGMNFGAPGMGNEQSKKKRNKGRRTVDFPAGGSDDFSRFGQDDENAKRMGSRHKSRRKGKDTRHTSSTTQPLKAAKRKIRVTEAIRVADMAHQMGLKSNEIIKILFNLGIMATINQSLDLDTATLVAAEFDYEVEKAGFSEDDYLIPTEEDSPEKMLPRPPVVTIMGHVDHGKTSLLDAIRKSNVTSGEAGGITQHIGAYHVTTKSGEIVFLDTPGHEAFTAMRARGAQVTDLVILVVAADDGVMEQTREAINHSKAAGVPIMVAVNKMDKEGADPDRVLRELAELGLQAESWGGDTITAMVSAKSRQGLDDLLELVALQTEILELKANADKPARGRIVEAKLDKGRGPVATVLIQEGTLHQGDTFVCGVFSGRVRALFNDQGKKVKEAGPSMPVEVQGFDGVPEAGEEFVCVADEKLARRIAESRAMKQRERALAKESKVTLETFLSRRASDQEALTLNLVLKADVQGSLEAITEALNKLSTEKVRINVVHGGAGAISESDILLASASQAIIIGFNIRPTAKIKEVAENENVDIRYYDIIYKLKEDVQSAMQGMLAPVQREQYLGQAEVREAISVPKVGVIAGCYVSDGKMARNAPVRLLRNGVVIYTGKTTSLKRFKDDAKEVPKGLECGICLENYNDIKVGDIIEAFEIIEEAATL